MLAYEGTVEAWTVDELGEGLFIDPLVDAGATFDALQIAFGLFKAVLVLGLILTCLCLQEVLNGLDPGRFLVWLRGLRAWAGTCLVCLELGAWLC